MKITDVTLTLFAWDNIPPTTMEPTPADSPAAARSACCD